MFRPVFLNLFSEAEPLASILIAHGTHVFSGGILRPEGSKFEAECEGRERGGVLGKGAASLPPTHQLGGLGECCKLPQWGSGPNPDRKYILDLLRA